MDPASAPTMKFLFSVIFIQLLANSAKAFQCLDMSNQPVDWWAIYKLPIESGTANGNVPDGLGFYYMDIRHKQFTLSTVSLSDPNQAVAFTMAQYYNSKTDPNNFFIMYNDEPPPPGTKSEEKTEEKAVEFGHTKGMSLFDSSTGFWLVHSVPNFTYPNAFYYPHNGLDFGQSMLCISMNYNQLASIGTQLFYNHPIIYASQLPASMAQANPDLAKVIAKQFQQGGSSSSIKQLVSRGGTRFTSFAKSADFNADLYDSLVAPSLGVSLLVETWRRGDHIPLACGKPNMALDVQNVRVLQSNAFHYTKDHSKWAVSTAGTLPIVCIGDINRMTSQKKRGGGAVCMNDFFVWTAYKNTIVDTNHC